MPIVDDAVRPRKLGRYTTPTDLHDDANAFETWMPDFLTDLNLC
jgi:hypothetical protein